MKQGEGTEYYPNGQVKYEGYFEINGFFGQGRLFSSTGELLFEGEFEFDPVTV